MTVRSCLTVNRVSKSELFNYLCRAKIEKLINNGCKLLVIKSARSE